MSLVVIMVDGFTIGNKVFKRHDLVDTADFVSEPMSPKKQRDYYGKVMYASQERAHRYDDDEDDDVDVHLITANVREVKDPVVKKKTKR